MKTKENYLEEISEIRKLMEGSSRFLSLSGLSGILVGTYAVLGAFIAHQLLSEAGNEKMFSQFNLVGNLAVLTAVVLLLSLVTVILLTTKKVRKSDKKFWNPGSRLMMVNLTIPLVAGGLLILIFVSKGVFELVLPGTLLFYGLALVNAAKFTRQEIFYLGVFQIALGILAAIVPPFALLIWALGFGVLHIIYGALMYFRYEHPSKKAA